MVSFSVIVPTCHRNDDLERCLEGLQILATGIDSSRYEVIVTDDGGQTTAEALVRERFPMAKWFAGPRRGPAANRNFAASRATGDWLVFIDDDCTPGAGWLEAYATAIIADAQCAVFEGRTLPGGRKTRADQECPVNQEGGHLWSCNFAVRRSLFLELGGFDEKFPLPGFEDADLQRRLQNAGHIITFVPQALTHHPWRLRRGIRFCIALATSAEYFTSKYPAAKKVFVETWGIKRVVKIFVFEFPRNLFRYREGSFRALYLDLLTAFHVSLALAKRPQSAIEN